MTDDPIDAKNAKFLFFKSISGGWVRYLPVRTDNHAIRAQKSH